MTPFNYTAAPARVVFGAGSLQHLGREIEALGARRALVLSTPEQAASAQRVADLLGSRAAGVYAEARMHVPIETARCAREEARRVGADCAVAIGGGSTTGLGKAIALEAAGDASRFPILAIPTTYAGSEMTPIWGLTEDGVKKTGRDPRVLPAAVIYDPELTLTLPLGLTVTSALNAIAHAAEGLYAHDGNPVMSLVAEEGHPGCGCRPAAAPEGCARPRGAQRRALRRVVVRHGARQRRHGPAPQALPHPRRHVRPAARRGAHGGAAARACIQRQRRSRGDGARGARGR